MSRFIVKIIPFFTDTPLKNLNGANLCGYMLSVLITVVLEIQISESVIYHFILNSEPFGSASTIHIEFQRKYEFFY